MATNPLNRKQRRAARKGKPLARLGVAIQTGVARVVLDAPDGPQATYYWWATENPNATPEEIMATSGLHGPYGTEAEAENAAQVAVVGSDCTIIEGGVWDPAWEKPQ
jgi:hypothetical protein